MESKHRKGLQNILWFVTSDVKEDRQTLQGQRLFERWRNRLLNVYVVVGKGGTRRKVGGGGGGGGK